MNNQIAAILTVIEGIVLVVWRVLALGGAVFGVYSIVEKNPTLAIIVLVGGVLVEELVRFRFLKGRFPAGQELKLVILGVGIESVGWILSLSAGDALAAIVILFGFLSVEHAVIDLATSGRFRIADVLGFSAIEAAGGGIWVVSGIVGTVVVLLATSFFEHRDGIALSQRS